ncbi:MAG: hypothetical protein WD552_01210 [Candidatus Paceibacterota bacterium]
MDVIHNHPRWGKLVEACSQVPPTKIESNNKKTRLKRWEPYVKAGYAVHHQTVTDHLVLVKQAVAPMVVDALADLNELSRREIMDKLEDYHSADTVSFDNHDFSTPKEDLVVEAIMRITCLCYAFSQNLLLEEKSPGNSEQILVDTLNLEGPHLDRLSGSLNGFLKEFWPDEISRACCEFVEGRVEKTPNLTHKANDFSGNPKVWEPVQLVMPV